MVKESSAVKYRHEDKYLCDGVQNAILKARAAAVLRPDSHIFPEGGYYRVRSLYFDSMQDNCYYENENGIGEREKYRIRVYNADAAHILLEKKSKMRQMTLKQSCRIDETMCRALMAGKRIRILPQMPAVQRELLMEMQKKALRPVVIVEYVRYPFVEANGNVRITFDEDIASSNDVDGFLSDRILLRPVMPKGMTVLEVKWDEFLPGYIKHHIQLESLQWSSFSKYYLCRKYNAYGGVRV